MALTNGTSFSLAIAGLLQCALTLLGRWMQIVDNAESVEERDWVAEGVSVWLDERVPEGDVVGLRVGVSDGV